MHKPKQVKPLSNYRLKIEFEDGVAGIVDLSHLVGKGIFVAWNDATFFDRVQIGEFGEICWEQDIEVCSDALYNELIVKNYQLSGINA